MRRVSESCNNSPTSALGFTATIGVLIKCETSSYSVVMAGLLLTCLSARCTPLPQRRESREIVAVVRRVTCWKRANPALTTQFLRRRPRTGRFSRVSGLTARAAFPLRFHDGAPHALAAVMTNTHEYTSGVTARAELNRYVNLKLAALGQPPSLATAEPEFMALAAPLVRNHFEKDELFGWPLCPVDRRIQTFLDSYLSDVCPDGAARLPHRSLVLDRPGLART